MQGVSAVCGFKEGQVLRYDEDGNGDGDYPEARVKRQEKDVITYY